MPAAALTIHDSVQPFAEALDTIRLVVAGFYFVYEVLVISFELYNAQVAILSNDFAAAELAGTMYSVFIVGQYLTLGIVLTDILCCTFAGRLQQWYAHVFGGITERVLW